jgi:hypothetical protein
MRKTTIQLCVATVAATAAILTPASAAQAIPDNGVCQFESATQNQQQFFVPGNGHAMFRSQFDYVDGDLLRFKATGSTQIATWGDHKDPNGDTATAPDDGRWRAENVRKYALLMRIRSGTVQFISTSVVGDSRVLGANMIPWRWYAVGTDSGCLRVMAPPPAHFEFEINDDNIGDNNDGPTVTMKQWW